MFCTVCQASEMGLLKTVCQYPVKRLFLISLMIFLSGCQMESTELQWHQNEGYRWADVQLDFFGDTGFKKLSSSRTNIPFELVLTSEEIDQNQMLLHGSGVATGDVDGDGLTDLYFGQLNGPNKLYRNKGNFQFEDITEEAGVAHDGYYSTGVLFADIDGDRDQDLLVNTMEGAIGIYLNDGSGHFTFVEENGLGEGNGGSTFTMADIDGDGDLDLFIVNNKRKRVYDIFSREELSSDNIVRQITDNEQGRIELRDPFDQYFEIIERQHLPARLGEVGEYNKLFLNEGNGYFKEVTNEEGRFIDQNGEPAIRKREWSLTALFHDINGDRFPDLYVCNDYFGPDRIWINRGDGSFREIDALAIRNNSYSSMGVDISDINRDGAPDIFVTEMLSQQHNRRARQQISEEQRQAMINEADYRPQYMRNSLYMNRGDNTFAEIAYYSGLEASEWSWATRFLDVDLDGYEDLIINTGFAYDSIDMDYFVDRNRDKSSVNLDEAPELNLQNKIFRNNGDLTFTEKSSDWGFNERDVSYGLATADFDNDGDLDLVTSRFKSGAAVFENTTNSPRIAVRLMGKGSNTRAIGAKIELEGGSVKQSKEMVLGGDYLSGSDPFVVFSADEANTNHRITVTWPDGKQNSIDSVRANRIYEIEEPDSSLKASVPETAQSESKTLFEDVSKRINHQHHEEPFNDFSIQPLLPVRLSRLGPGISWIDHDSDGDDDLFIASGRGGRMAVYENRGDGTFQSFSEDKLTQSSPADQTTILGWIQGNETKLLVGTANYETGDLRAPSMFHYTYQQGKITEQDSISGVYSTTGPMVASDYDGDGDLDLFIGGRFIPAHYPMNATSRLFKNDNGKFILDKPNSALLDRLGMVTGAVFSDIDQDGDPDLLLSREWDSLMILENNNGTFTDVTDRYGLHRYSGWWNGITTGDFNNDGRPDIVTTNMGLNSPYQMDSGHPLRMFYQDFNRDGRADIIESYFDPGSQSYVPRRQMEAYGPLTTSLFRGVENNRAYADASLDELLLTNLEELPSRQINMLTHMLFINKGDHFEAYPLPDEAQFTAAVHAGVADFDNDGNEDLFLSQNFFGFPPEVPRQDAGRGLWLQGNGTGEFSFVPGHISGIKVYGEQRGSAFSDFNNDGKVDLAISQNGATTKLYVNRVTNNGISVRLTGTSDNEMGIGSSVRILYQDGIKGPLREIQAGSGYWSQNSTVQILGILEDHEPAQLQIHWTDGTEQVIDLQNGKLSYEISHPSNLN